MDKFTLKERMAYFKKKWLRENLAAIILCYVAVIAACVVGVLRSNAVITGGVSLAALVLYGFLHNRMMAYVESHVFDN